MQLKKISLIIFMALNMAGKLCATTYYVSPTGTSSASGSIKSPLNFSAAISKSLTAGDSILLREGTYSFSTTQTLSKSGNVSNYLTIVAYPGESVIFDFRGQAYSDSSQGLKLSGSYVHVKGVVIQGAGDNGLQVTGSNNVVENCVFRWNCDSGLQMKSGSNNLIKNCDSYENFDYKTGGTSSPDYGGNADGFADKQYENSGANTYKGCRSWFNSDDGWDSYEKIGNTVYDSCWCYANAPVSYDMTDHIRFKTDSATWFYQFKNSGGRYVVANYGNGNGFKVGGNYTSNNATLSFCVSALNKVKGFDQNNNNGLMTLYNCSGYQNNPDYGFSNSSYGTLLVYNSATLASKSTNKLNSKSVTQSHNSWLTGFGCSTSDFLSLDYSQLIQSRQADGSLPEISFLHQKSSSAMIDKGTNVNLFYFGTAPDLGAFEYNPSSGISESSKDEAAHIEFDSETKEIVVTANNGFASLSIYTISGQLVLSHSGDSETTSVNVSGWKYGIYFVQVKSTENSEVAIKKIFVF
jgi:Secretion system C-terminal sorting domain